MEPEDPLADVDAVCFQRQSQVNAVVDDEGNTAGSQEIPYGQSFPVTGSRIRIGGAVLHDGNSSVRRFPYGFQKAEAAFGCFIRDQIEMEIEFFSWQGMEGISP